MRKRLARFKNVILDILYPRECVCLFCGKENVLTDKHICTECEKLLEIPPMRTVKGLDGVFVGLVYEGNAAECIKAFKYGGRRENAYPLAEFLQLPEDFAADFIVPVPIHWQRRLKRGYNQCELLADMLSERCGIPVNRSLLKKCRRTETQVRTKPELRHTNLAGSFSASDCKGLTLLLVDDVITTGSTLTECAKTLRAAGAKAVYGVCTASRQIKNSIEKN